MKRFFTLFILILSLQSFGQNFHFEPTNELTKTIVSSDISDLNIDIIRNNTVDTLYLEYELITNTLPDEWYQGYCDNHGCWGSLPESGVMSACYEDLNSYIKLSIHPNNFEGSGSVEYYVYEVDNYNNGILMTFNISTPGFVGINKLEDYSLSIYPIPADDYIELSSNQVFVSAGIYSLTGHLIKELNQLSLSERIDISDINSGIYLLNLIDIEGNQLTRKLTIN